MPEGDTIHRVADVMRRTIGGDEIIAAHGRPGGAQLERVVGSHVERVSSRGKHMLIGFSNSLTLHTHLRMQGMWHRYRPGEGWRVRADRARAVLETASAVVVCFDAPTVELIDTRALAIHPVLAALGPDLLADDPDLDEVAARIAAASVCRLTIAEALLDQRIVAGIGNVYRSEVLALNRCDPFILAHGVSGPQLRALLESAGDLLRANLEGGERQTMSDATGAKPGAGVGPRQKGRWVYGRSGRSCRRCASPIKSGTIGDPARRLYWCPSCQGDRGSLRAASRPASPG